MIDAFYSDPHFGHKNIIEYSNRPFEGVYHMNMELIERYNAVVRPNHACIWVGDCFFKSSFEESRQILKQLNGRKLLVRGNHDRSVYRMHEMGFMTVAKEMYMQISGRNCRINHFPYANEDPDSEYYDRRFIDQRPPRIKGEVLIHGHTHAKKKVWQNQVHVGVDAWDYAPARFSEVADIILSI